MRKLLAFVLSLGAVTAYAANKSATLVPPAAMTDLRSIHVEPSNCPKVTNGVCDAPAAVVTIDACAKDVTTGALDCGVATVVVPYSNAQLQNIVNSALTAWKNAKPGY